MSNFLAATANYDDFINMQSGEINNHLQKNNEAILKKAFTFFQGDSKILLINGFAGVGKMQISEHTLSYLDKKTITLKCVCTESTTLDDIHLQFLDTLKKKTSLKTTSELDAIESMGDKIDYFISNIDNNFVPVFYNFEDLSEETKTAVLDYIISLSSNPKIKIIICSKTFDTDKIPESIKYVKIMPKALSKELFEVYLREFGIKITPAMLDQLYRLSRGYQYSTCISAKIMINRELTINDFIVQYTNSGEKFDTFLAKTYYKLIVGTTKSVFNLFVTLHHGLNMKVLKSLGSYPDNIIKMLLTNFYIYKRGDLYYPTDFLKVQLKNIISDEVSAPRLIKYYESQLKLPIEERDILISRISLHNEIERCKTPSPEDTQEPQQVSEAQPTQEQDAQTEPTQKKEDVYSSLSMDKLLELAKDLLNKFEYYKSIEVLGVILDRKSEFSEPDTLYTVYNMLAKTYEKLTKWQYALHYYDLLEQHYTSLNDIERLHNIQFEKGSIYYKSYRIVDAIKILKQLSTVSKDSKILAKVNLLIGNIALSTSNKELAKQHYKIGIENIDETFEKPLQMELYFKYAVLSDKNNDMTEAVEYYNKCINIDDKSSKYKSLAYSNLGDLFYENELFDDSKTCFEKAYQTDKENGSEYGMYYALSKIIEMTDKKDKDLLVKLALEAKDHALKTDDYNALLMSVITLGDVYYDYPDPEKALMEYLALYNEGVEVIEEPNFSLIKSRIEDIRARLGKERFEELVPNYV